ncbi:MAG: hypothetical protein AAFN41_01625 [Planctomycetota bacterium]
MRSALIAAACAAAAPTLAQPELALTTTFQLPANAAFDVQPDGTLLAINGDGIVLQQDAINGDTFFASGTIGTVNANAFAPSFVAISPDGQSVAVGNNEFNTNNAVSFFDTTELLAPGAVVPLNTVITPNFKADWAGNTTLFVAGADSATFGTVVNQLFITGNAAETVIAPAGGFSGGIAVDNNTLYVGDGASGDVRAFTDSTITPAPAEFTAGTFITSATSASDIDTLGDLLLVAGAVFGGEGNATVFDQATGLSTVLTPAGADAFYGGYFNTFTNQLVVTANGTAYVYDIIPAPATLALAPAALMVIRRRRA